MMTPVLPPIIIEEHTLLLIVFLMLLGGGVIGAVCHACHYAQRHTPAHKRTPWIAVTAAVVILLLVVRPDSEPDYISPADRILLKPPPTKLTLDTTDCPPLAAGMTSQLIFTVESRADAKPVVTGCTRIAERQYVTRK